MGFLNNSGVDRVWKKFKEHMVNYVSSRGENLITNGTCMLGDNTNFSQFEYDGSDTYYAGGSFSITAKNANTKNDEYIPVDISNKYTLSYYIKTDNENARYYDMLLMYDVDKKIINATNIMWMNGSTTKLAKDLKKGDTVVYLEDVSGFNYTTYSYQRGFIFWDYTNSKGYTYEPETYSRNVYQSLWDDNNAIDIRNNTITLKNPWSDTTVPAGTHLSQCNDGNSYTYFNSGYGLTKDTWTKMTGSISGVGKNNESRKFREGTAFVKIGWLIPYNATELTTTKISTISLTQNANISDLDREMKQINANSDNKYTKKGVLSFSRGNELMLEETQLLGSTKSIFIGYRLADNTVKELVDAYYFCNGNRGNLADIYAKRFIGTLNGSASEVNGHTVDADVPSDAKFTDTTYTEFQGTEGTHDGVAGLVPAPKAYEFGNSYGLGSDGTWRDFGQTFVSQSFAEGEYATNEALKNAIEELKKYVDKQSPGGVTLDSVYPIGSVYISANDSNPNAIIGGTWEEFAIGRTLIGYNPDDDDLKTIGMTGGEKTHTLTVEEMPLHNHSASTGGAGKHTHTVGYRKRQDAYGKGTMDAMHWNTGTDSTIATSEVANHSHTVTVESAGSGMAHNNMPPYITVRMWKRTA